MLVPAVFRVFKKMNLCSCEMIMRRPAVDPSSFAALDLGGTLVQPPFARQGARNGWKA
jgi:hypothetical protein